MVCRGFSGRRLAGWLGPIDRSAAENGLVRFRQDVQSKLLERASASDGDSKTRRVRYARLFGRGGSEKEKEVGSWHNDAVTPGAHEQKGGKKIRELRETRERWGETSRRTRTAK